MMNVRDRQAKLATQLRRELGSDFVVVPVPDHPLVMRSVDVLVGGRSGLTAFMMPSAEERRRPMMLEARLTLNQVALPPETQFVYVADLDESSPTVEGRFAEQIRLGDRSFGRNAAAIAENAFREKHASDSDDARQRSQSRFAVTYRVARLINVKRPEGNNQHVPVFGGANLAFDTIKSVPSAFASRKISTRTLIGLSVRGAERWYEPSKRQPLPIATPAGLVFSPGFPRPRNPDKALRAAAFAGWILAPTFSLRSPEELAELALRFTKPR